MSSSFKEIESFDDFQDVESMVQNIFKFHNLGENTEKLELIEKINDSLQGKIVDEILR